MEKTRELWENTLKVGNAGESFIKNFCLENNKNYVQGSDDENKVEGIDAYIEGVPTDIKATCKIFLAKYMLNYNRFHVRHPFRDKTKAINYCILDEIDKKFSIRYMGGIEDYLIQNYFRNKESLVKIKTYLNKMEGKNFRQCGFKSENEMFLKIKMKIKYHLKQEIYCTFTSKEQSRAKEQGELNIALLTYEDHHKLNENSKFIF